MTNESHSGGGWQSDAFIEELAEAMCKPPTPEEEAAFKEFLGKGWFVGCDENGELVWEYHE
jgi:hypothetical protein